MAHSPSKTRKKLLKLSTQEVAKLLGSLSNNQTRVLALETFTSLSLEERSKLQEGGIFSFADLINEIVLLDNQELAEETLEAFLKAYPRWSTEFVDDKIDPLHLSLSEGKLNLFDVLLQYGADPVKIQGRMGLLGVAIKKCRGLNHRYQQAIMEAVLETNAFSNTLRLDALSKACCEGLPGAVRALVKNDPKLFLNSGFDFTSVAIRFRSNTHLTREKSCYTEVVRVLLGVGDAKEILNRYWVGGSKASPLHEASYRGDLEVMQLLIDKGAMIDGFSFEERMETPLMTAAFGAQFDAISFLLQKGANAKTHDKRGRNALHFLASFERSSHDDDATSSVGTEEIRCADLLLQAGVLPDEKSDDGKTPIELAQEHGYLLLSSYLLSKVLQTNVKENMEEKSSSLQHVAKPHKM